MEALSKHLSGNQAPPAEPGPQTPPPAGRIVTFAEDDKEQPMKARKTTNDDVVARPLHRSVTYIPSQVGSPDDSSVNYTSNPLKLLWYDLKLSISKLPAAPGIIFPWRIGKYADPFDELYPNLGNIVCLSLHAFLIFTQVAFVISLPFCLFLPVLSTGIWVAVNLIFNSLVTSILNGTQLKVHPTIEVDREGKFSDEYWIFLNGVSVG